MAFRRSAVMLAALAFPPLRPPSRPSATAAWFFRLGIAFCGGCLVVCETMDAASVFRSSLLERFCMAHSRANRGGLPALNESGGNPFESPPSPFGEK